MQEQHAAIGAMQQAAHEIRELRRQNELLHARVETMDLFALVLNTRPAYPSSCASQDIAHVLDKIAADMKTSPENPEST